ncbi:hypothetical protein [Amycolatopsis mediterranei]|nr:hypothetical protein [Amycolatopsis mediterranei]AEK44141.1 hypothetical protein RAM_28320 [Amycolatopsis mediterranei S699]UZF72319.1 hypothetical protein ISP_005658 [Amycolatopsis mediterranei]
MTTYPGSGDERTHDREYFPEWLGNLADDVTMEASVVNGIARGPQAVRDILGFARTLYDYQEFIFKGEYGENGFAEDYVARFADDRPIGNVVVVRRNPAGQTSGIVISHRPLAWASAIGVAVQRCAGHREPAARCRGAGRRWARR